MSVWSQTPSFVDNPYTARVIRETFQHVIDCLLLIGCDIAAVRSVGVPVRISKRIECSRASGEQGGTLKKGQIQEAFGNNDTK
jgi:hypothetical protein